MTTTLPTVAHEHHERLIRHIDEMPAIADALLAASTAETRQAAVDLGAFIAGTLLPHVDAAERAVYPELERLFQNRHSMAPMRREHEEIRRLAADYGRLVSPVAAGHATLGSILGLRRVLFALYALLKVHLAEEEAYARLIGRGADDEAGALVAVALEHPIAG